MRRIFAIIGALITGGLGIVVAMTPLALEIAAKHGGCHYHAHNWVYIQ